MSGFLIDFRYAIRLLRKDLGFTAIALTILAAGIAATTSMFTVVDGVLLRPLPFKNPDRLVLVKERVPKLLDKPITIRALDVLTFGRENIAFEGLAGFLPTEFDFTGQDSPLKIMAARVGWNLFTVLGVQPLMGRSFTADEDHPDTDVAIVSYPFWKQQLGGRSSVIGEKLTLDGKPYQIVGVMGPGFEFPLHTDKAPDLWVPMGFTVPELDPQATNFAYGAVARLKAGVRMAQAEADVEGIAKRIEQSLDVGRRGDLQIFATVVNLEDDTVTDVRRPLLILFVAVTFILLIALVNVANLLLARGTTRQRELAIRMALGAGARRVVRQLLIESVILGLMSGAVGFLLAALATKALVAIVPLSVPRLQTITVDGHIFLFALIISLLSGVIFGGVPAIFALHANVNDGLKEGGRGVSTGRNKQRVRSCLAAAQLALAMVLLAGAGLLLRSFQRVLQVDPGFRPDHVISAAVSLSPTQYSSITRLRSFYLQLRARLEQIPGSKAAGLSTDLPLETQVESAFAVDGYVPPPGAGLNLNAFSFVLGDYFQAMGVPLLRGRIFTSSDDEHTQRVAIISQSIAERFFAGRDPVGGRLKLGTANGGSPWMTVVGVVGDVKPFGLDDESLPHTYMPYLQAGDDDLKTVGRKGMNMTVRTAGDPISAAASMRTAVWSLDRQVPVTDMRTMEQVISQSNAPRRFNVILVAFFACSALLLATVGLYGVVSYSVSQRTHEIGVRMTLGARPADILRMVLGSGFKLVLIGITIGLAGALAASRLLTRFLFQVRASDPTTFALVALSLATVALLASLLPSLRATRVDPMITLRHE